VQKKNNKITKEVTVAIYPRCKGCRRALPELYEPEHLCGNCLNETIDRKDAAAAARKTPAAKPPWCGKCEERTRHSERERDGQPEVSRCPRCHPLRGEPLPQERWLREMNDRRAA
jgi:hypothetical protein